MMNYYHTILKPVFRAASQQGRDINDYCQKRLLNKYHLPFMKSKEIDIIKELLTKLRPYRCLEWGCGYSTLYFPSLLPRASSWVSIEHDKNWHDVICTQAKNSNVSLIHIEPNNPDFVKHRKEGLYEDFQRYVDYPLSMGKFDFILIDGRARRYCLKNASEIIDDEGVVIVHDANRRHYFDDTSPFPHTLLLTDCRVNRGGIWVGSKKRSLNDVLRTDFHERIWKINDAITRCFVAK